jgi:hypothetical protein
MASPSSRGSGDLYLLRLYTATKQSSMFKHTSDTARASRCAVSPRSGLVLLWLTSWLILHFLRCLIRIGE